MAIRLRQAGFDQITVFEQASSVGGTWRDNHYPGAACDVPSHLYSLSFAPKADWTRAFPTQPEILAYLESLVDDFDLSRHLRLATRVTEARFDDAPGTWTLTLADGTTEVAEVVVAATGQLNRPHIPAIPGLDRFEGPAFHSARWQHDAPIDGADVAVIGIGASAIQFVPELAARAATVTLYQRSPNYVGPKRDAPISDRRRHRYATHPALRRLHRLGIWLRFDARWVALRRGSRLGALAQARFRAQLEPLVSDDLPAGALIPEHPLGCRRILISDDWYPTLRQPHVHVVTDALERIERDGVVAGGTARRADAIVFGTGFRSTEFLTPMRVVGRHGIDLHERWSDGAQAHLGITVSGFPNLFLLYGPNTNLGHNSIVFMLERQIAYALTCIRALVEDDLAWIDVRDDVEAASNAVLQRRLRRTVWAAGCHSWYKTATGRITNNWAGPTAAYWWRTARPRLGDFERRSRTSTL